MNLSAITKEIAVKISSSPKFELLDFIEKGDCNDYFLFTHYPFFYSYPEFGKKWKNEQSCQFHKIDIKCNLCDYVPERNKIGVGDIYLLHNGISDAEILVIQKDKSRKYVKNIPRLSPMVCLCEKHIGSYFPYNKEQIKNRQLELF